MHQQHEGKGTIAQGPSPHVGIPAQAQLLIDCQCNDAMSRFGKEDPEAHTV